MFMSAVSIAQVSASAKEHPVVIQPDLAKWLPTAGTYARGLPEARNLREDDHDPAHHNRNTLRANFVLCAVFLVTLTPLSVFGFQLQRKPQTTRQISRKDPKLSSALQSLSETVPQVQALGTNPAAGAWRNISIKDLPKQLTDMISTKRLRVNDDNEAQVYIEVDQITGGNLESLTALGVKVQVVGQLHPNKKMGEVRTAVPTLQALLPLGMISLVENLEFVRYIRLPDYAIPNTGSVDSQGDSILQADVVRSSTGLDGTGVRVGVISDGIGGIFATGCTTCQPTTSNPSPISLTDLPPAVGTRNLAGVLTATSGGITAKSFYSDGNLEACFGTCDTTSNTGAEGTAMMEIVHDLAPGAQLYFSNGDPSMYFEAAVDYLAANTDIVVTDISYLSPPFDGTNSVSQSLSDALNDDGNPVRGIFASVGNYAQDHYQGQYTPSGTDGVSITGEAGNLHLFAGTGNIQTTPGATGDMEGFGGSIFDPIVVVPPGQKIEAYLAWNDPTGASTNDYDLFLLPLSCSGQKNSLPLPPCSIVGSPLASSTNPQTGSQDPTESLSWANNTKSAATLGIIIQNISNAAAPRIFDLFIHGYGDKESSPNHNFVTPSGSVPAVSDAGGTPVSVVSVGAINQAQCPAAANCIGSLEAFSSLGPTEATPQAASRTKPDLVAVDKVCITGAGGFGNGAATDCPPSMPTSYAPQLFGGTSAASPHVAAIAALTLQSAPCLLAGATNPIAAATGRTNLRNILVGNSIPLPGVLGTIPNDTEGNGLVDALGAEMSTLPTVAAGTTQTVSATSSSGVSLQLPASGTDPNGCPLVAVQWNGSCGAGVAMGAALRANLSCPIGINTVSMQVSNNGKSFSTPSAVPATVIVTDFTVSASQSSQVAYLGVPTTFSVAVSSTSNGAFSNPVSLSCSAGLPPGATCSFSPATLTPGASIATSVLTVYSSGLAFNQVDPAKPRSMLPLGGFVFAAVIFVPFFSYKRGRKRSTIAIVTVLATLPAIALLALIGCSSHKSTPTPTTYSITVTGTSNQLVHNASISLTLHSLQ
jgi:Subtilase family